MKTPLKIAALALAFACSSAAQAQGGGGGRGMSPEIMAAQRAKQWEGITLTPDQTKKLADVEEAQTKKQAELRAGGGDMRSPDMREKMMSMRAETQKAIKALLTTEQAAQYDKNSEAMAAARRGGSGV